MSQHKMMGQPKELKGKPLITEGNPDFYLGQIIIELWQNPPNPDGSSDDEPSFAWIVDKANDLPREEWVKLLLNGLKRAVRYIEDAYGGK